MIRHGASLRGISLMRVLTCGDTGTLQELPSDTMVREVASGVLLKSAVALRAARRSMACIDKNSRLIS